MRDRQTCVGCGKKSPETETNYTLISAQFGWRLTRYKSPDGSLVVEWRCPTCWREYKKSRAPSSPDAISGRESQIPPSVPPVPRPPLARPPTPFESFRPRAPSTPVDPRHSRATTPVVPAPPRRTGPPPVPAVPPPLPPAGRPKSGPR
jgi:hypothetical protein